jgi:hypothetical protein
MIAELGVDMSVFKSKAHVAAWAGVCPGNNESAGKRKREGRSQLLASATFTSCSALVEAAHGASRKNGTCPNLNEKFFRLKARRGYLRRAVAIAHKILKAAYVILCTSTGVEYCDLGTAYLDAIDAQRVKENLVRRLERLGYEVTISPHATERSALAPGAVG